MNGILRANLGVRLGEVVLVERATGLPPGLKVEFCHLGPHPNPASGDLVEECLEPYFGKSLRPVHEGDVYRIPLKGNSPLPFAHFLVTETEPSPSCTVRIGTTTLTCLTEAKSPGPVSQTSDLSPHQFPSQSSISLLNFQPFLRRG
jgi:hypothetical protein